MTLLVTLFLVLITIFNDLANTSPNVDGFNAASAWIFSCLIFIFGALAAYAGILFKKRMLFKVSVLFNQKYRLRNVPKFNILHHFQVFNSLKFFYFSNFLTGSSTKQLHGWWWKIFWLRSSWRSIFDHISHPFSHF